MGDPRRWLLWVALAAALGFAGASLFRKGTTGEVVDCLTDAQCGPGRRCLVAPKGDGFATLGFCAKECQGGGDCQAPLECQPVTVVSAHVEAVAPGIGPLMVCRLNR